MKYPVLDSRATGQRIRKLREERHITVKELSSFMGFSGPEAIYKWQRGDSLPTVDNLYALSKYFGCQMEEILVEDMDEAPGNPPLFCWYLSALCTRGSLLFFIESGYHERNIQMNILSVLLRVSIVN